MNLITLLSLPWTTLKGEKEQHGFKFNSTTAIADGNISLCEEVQAIDPDTNNIARVGVIPKEEREEFKACPKCWHIFMQQVSIACKTTGLAFN